MEQAQQAVRRRYRRRQRYQQCAGAALFPEPPEPVNRHMTAQHQIDQQQCQHNDALQFTVPRPIGDVHPVLLRRQSRQRHQRRKKRPDQRAALRLRILPVLRGDLAKLRLVSNGVRLGHRLGRRRRVHGIVELLRVLLLPLPGEQPPLRLQQRFPMLLHDCAHRGADQLFQTQEAGLLRPVLWLVLRLVRFFRLLRQFCLPL